jgi:sulfofructose kinase
MDVVGIGFPCIDFLINVDQFPETNSAAILREFSWQGGGKVATALVTLGRLGVETGFAGVVGGDAFGTFLVEDFKRHGVDTSRLIVDAAASTSLSVPISEKLTGGRSFIFNFGTCRKLQREDLDAEYIASAKILHLENMDPVSLAAAAIARQNRVKVVIDADHENSASLEWLAQIDVLVASEFYYKAYFKDSHYEENCRNILSMGPQIVVFTLGGRGCVGMDAGGYFELPAFQVPVTDTTGAGDVYHGAFIYGLLQGWKTLETARFASAVAAIKCTRLGGRAAIPDLETTLGFLRDGTVDFSEIDRRVAFYRNLPGSPV